MERIDHYGDGAWYDAEYVHIRGDLPYYREVARAVEGPILELACGTGRLTFAMIEAGAEVCGIDIAPAMVAQARRRRAALSPPNRDRLTLALGDMRTFRAGRVFAGVVLGFNTLMHMLTDDDLRSALRTVGAHLPPGGRFYFDVHTPMPELLERDPNGRYDPQQMIEPGTGHRIIVTESNTYDPATQINAMRFYYQRVDRDGAPIGPERYAEVRLRMLEAAALDRLLAESGLEVVEDWGSFDRDRSFARSGRRVVVAARR